MCDRDNFENQLKKVQLDYDQNLEILNKQLEYKDAIYNESIIKQNQDLQNLNSEFEVTKQSSEQKIKSLNLKIKNRNLNNLKKF